MTEHGLQPDFSAAAQAQAGAATTAATAAGPSIRDLRDRLWASIDNDDSRDLDQLSVAEPQPDGRVKILVAIADVDALVAAGSPIDDHARGQHDVGLHRGGHLPDAAGEALDRSHLAQRRPGSRWRSSSTMTVDAGRHDRRVGRLPRHRAESRQARVQQRRRMADGTRRPRRRGWPRCRDSTSSCGCRTASRNAMQRGAARSTARSASKRIENAAGIRRRPAYRSAARRKRTGRRN